MELRAPDEQPYVVVAHRESVRRARSTAEEEHDRMQVCDGWRIVEQALDDATVNELLHALTL